MSKSTETAREMGAVSLSDIYTDPDPNRARRVEHAVFTVLNGYLAADCPCGHRDDLARGALIWLNEADPGATPNPTSESEYREQNFIDGKFVQLDDPRRLPRGKMETWPPSKT